MTDRLQGIGAFVDERWDGRVVDLLHDYIRIPCKSTAVRPRLGGERPHRRRGRPARRLGGGPADPAGMTVDVAAPRGPHSADPVRDPGDRRRRPTDRHRDALRPPRQAARDARAGTTARARGCRCSTATGSTAAAAPTTATPRSPASPRSRRSQPAAAARPAAWCSSRPARSRGSPDLPAHVEALAGRIGDVDLVVCLDCGCANYDRLWVTTSLAGSWRAPCGSTCSTEGEHSGRRAGRAVELPGRPRLLLDRVEDERHRTILLPELHVDDARRTRAAQVAAAAADDRRRPRRAHPWAGDPARWPTTRPRLLLQRTWRPTLSVTGARRRPRPRTPPATCCGRGRRQAVVPPAADCATRSPPRAAVKAASSPIRSTVRTVTLRGRARRRRAGAAPPTAPWLAAALDDRVDGRVRRARPVIGEGGSIPFMGMLGERFPAAQFAVIGVLGPGSSAHGPNEFLHLPTARAGHRLRRPAPRRPRPALTGTPPSGAGTPGLRHIGVTPHVVGVGHVDAPSGHEAEPLVEGRFRALDDSR